jgi:hypothetical protein
MEDLGIGATFAPGNRVQPTMPLVIIGIISILVLALWIMAARWFRHLVGPDLAPRIYHKVCFLAACPSNGWIISRSSGK